MYNANPNYEMNFAILKDVNEHMEGLFQRFSKLLPFRIDFAYRKDTPSFGHSCKHSMCMEIYRLLSETQTMLAGYYWVMEYTPDKGLHIHFVGYLDGQRHKNSYQISRQLGDIWRRITEGEGYFHCVFRSIRSRIGIEVRSAIRIHSINRELNFFYRFLTRFFAAFHYRGIFPQ